MDFAAQLQHPEPALARDEFTKREIDRFAFGRHSRQSPRFVQHSIVDLDVRPHAHENTPARVYSPCFELGVPDASSDHASQHQRADHHQHERGEHIAPALEPLAADLVTAPRRRERQAHDCADRDRGEDH